VPDHTKDQPDEVMVTIIILTVIALLLQLLLMFILQEFHYMP